MSVRIGAGGVRRARILALPADAIDRCAERVLTATTLDEATAGA